MAAEPINRRALIRRASAFAAAGGLGMYRRLSIAAAATLGMHTGSVTIPLPSIGSWVSYGLGTLNTNLPSFVVLAAREPYNGHQVWDSNFLPAYHKGVRVIPGPTSLPDVRSPVTSVS